MVKGRKIVPEHQVTPIEALAAAWKKYGTWVIAAAAVVLAIVLLISLVTTNTAGKLAQARQALDDISLSDANRLLRLQEVEHKYGQTELGPRIRTELAWEYLGQRDYAKAEPLLQEIVDSPDAPAFFKARARLGLAYAAMDNGKYEEAQKRFEEVENEKLYAVEARHMLKVIAEMKDVAPEAGAAAGTTPAVDVVPTPMPPE